MDDDQLSEEPLSAEEILTFGPCVEAQVWTPVWLQEARAPIAVAAGRPKLGPVFNDDGVGRIAVIRPCMSRGRRVRGLAPVYTPRMLEGNASVFDGWPMFMDHVPPAVQEALAKRGRSVKELGGQVLKGGWSRDFTHEDDAQFGYQAGAVLAEAWATPFVRRMVGENPNLLHTSINAWPTSGKLGPVPWRPAVKGMLIEGIRRQPQGSVDYVVRGGAGGRLLLLEGVDGEPGWPEVGEWDEESTRFVVSLAESFYASPRMEITLPTKPEELRGWLQEHAPHLVAALTEAPSDDDADDKPGKRKRGKPADDQMTEGLTEAQVREILAEATSGQPSVEEFTQSLEERMQEQFAEREQQRDLSARALEMIREAEGIPAGWKQDLAKQYTVRAGADAPVVLLVESEDLTGENGATLTPLQVLEARVSTDLTRVRELLAEAQGKPRPTGEGSGRASGEGARSSNGRREEVPHWRKAFVGIGLAESEDKAVEVFGGRVEG